MKKENDLTNTMEKNLVADKLIDTTTNEVVIVDECGDSLWDAVLAQELIK